MALRCSALWPSPTAAYQPAPNTGLRTVAGAAAQQSQAGLSSAALWFGRAHSRVRRQPWVGQKASPLLPGFCSISGVQRGPLGQPGSAPHPSLSRSCRASPEVWGSAGPGDSALDSVGVSHRLVRIQESGTPRPFLTEILRSPIAKGADGGGGKGGCFPYIHRRSVRNCQEKVPFGALPTCPVTCHLGTSQPARGLVTPSVPWPSWAGTRPRENATSWRQAPYWLKCPDVETWLSREEEAWAGWVLGGQGPPLGSC